MSQPTTPMLVTMRLATSRIRLDRIIPLNALGARCLRGQGDANPGRRSEHRDDHADEKRVVEHSAAVRWRADQPDGAEQHAGSHAHCANGASAADGLHLRAGDEPLSLGTGGSPHGPRAAGKLISWSLPSLVLKQKLNHSLTNCNSPTRASEEAARERAELPCVPFKAGRPEASA
jgi:hypothetical protein